MRFYKEVVVPKIETGEIIECELQKDYILQPKFEHNGKTIQPIKYVADFYLRYKDGTERVVDVKGLPDNTAKIKRKLFWYTYRSLDYVWISYSLRDGGWINYDDLQKIRRERKKLNQVT